MYGRMAEKNKEQGIIIKKGSGFLRTALVYPNTYNTGMSSLGFQTVYKLANEIDFVACERFFLPNNSPKQDQQSLKSLESGFPLKNFDIILFSISFENDFLNIVKILQKAGIPLRSSDRYQNHPLIVAGGIACILNPEPISYFMDCFLLGEAECMLEKFFSFFMRQKNNQSFLQRLEEKIPGAYVPFTHDKNTDYIKKSKIKVQYQKNLDNTFTHTCILSSNTTFKNTFLIEISKGCPYACKFCSAGFFYHPLRNYPLKNIKQSIDKAKGKTDRIGLVSSAIADHPDLLEICDYGLENGFKLSFASIRTNKINDEIISKLVKSKTKTVAIAPETGSQRLRDIINKQITDKQILLSTKKLVEAGIINLKIYYIIGLPFENNDDIYAIVDLTKKIKQVFLQASRKKSKIGTITLSINPFIPKPFTPFQWALMEKKSILKDKMNIIRQGLKKVPNIKLNFESLRKAQINAFLSLADKKAGKVIEDALKYGWQAAIRKNKDFIEGSNL